MVLSGCEIVEAVLSRGFSWDAAEFRAGKEEFAEFFLISEKYSSNFGFLGMAAKNVDALEERLEGEMNQIKETVEERMSSMEGQVADLRDMMKKMLEFQTQSAASDAKGPEAKNTNSEIHREEEEVEIVEGRRGRPHLEPFQREERGGGYGERQGYGGMEPRGAGWEHREGYYGRRGAVFEDRRGDFEGFDTIREYKGSSRNHNLVVPFGGITSQLEGPVTIIYLWCHLAAKPSIIGHVSRPYWQEMI
ncbi:hypothetical protein M5K25_010331 [Dendrobium thyrsiflorum]|uniref:Uncharacterized protein n=1 Tax=Dendrobium thyrsiflorum TaxID=117978 RepID=A0ABD0V794_DENTH